MAQEASDLTNYVNQAATYGSASFIGNNTMVMANMLTHNMNQGMPIHHNPDKSNPDQGKAIKENKKCLLKYKFYQTKQD